MAPKSTQTSKPGGRKRPPTPTMVHAAAPARGIAKPRRAANSRRCSSRVRGGVSGSLDDDMELQDWLAAALPASLEEPVLKCSSRIQGNPLQEPNGPIAAYVSAAAQAASSKPTKATSGPITKGRRTRFPFLAMRRNASAGSIASNPIGDAQITVILARGVEQPPQIASIGLQHSGELGRRRRGFANGPLFKRHPVVSQPTGRVPAGGALGVGVNCQHGPLQ